MKIVESWHMTSLPSSATHTSLPRNMRKREAARYCAISVRTLENWMSLGWVSYTRIGRTVIFRVDDLERTLSRFRIGTRF